ncbi:GD16289 [Drosophila simulans]|uniref:GD16289 n=1 Tax=Drosophila simulans TaxID=7240 RepID=B4R4J3_DROSI|nr:GD16289 [Drosophila simulans]
MRCLMMMDREFEMIDDLPADKEGPRKCRTIEPSGQQPLQLHKGASLHHHTRSVSGRGGGAPGGGVAAAPVTSLAFRAMAAWPRRRDPESPDH